MLIKEEARKEKIRQEEAERDQLEIQRQQNEKAKAEEVKGSNVKSVPIQMTKPVSNNVLVISQNDQFVGGEKNIYFTPSGEMIDTQAEMESMNE